jgi:hypothetical protein
MFVEYTIVLIVHLLCAIIFLGYVFADVIVFPIAKKNVGEKVYEEVKKSIAKRAIKIFPFMLSKYINSHLGVFNTPLQQLLMLKLFLAGLIVLGVLYSLYTKVTNKKPVDFMKHFHKFVLVSGFFIVVLAKYMFVA